MERLTARNQRANPRPESDRRDDFEFPSDRADAVAHAHEPEAVRRSTSIEAATVVFHYRLEA